MEVWSDPLIVVMDYDEVSERTNPKGCVSIFFDYSPGAGKIYSLGDIPKGVNTVFLDQEGIKGLIEVLKEFVDE
jgi:hypothetical protein